MKIIFRTWFIIGGFLLWLLDSLRGTVFSTSSDCAQDADGHKAITNQMKCDRAAGEVAPVATTAELGHMILRDVQIAKQNNKPAVAHGNIAHRDDEGNGAGFCIAHFGKIWVIATEGGYTWSGLRLYGLVRKVFRLNWEECINYLFQRGLISKKDHAELYDTQFRSLKLSWLLRFYRLGFRLPGQWIDVSQISVDLEALSNKQFPEVVVGYRDGKSKKGFFNTYLLLTAKMIGAKIGDGIIVYTRELDRAIWVQFVHRLKDVPEGELRLVEVSAGYDGQSLLGLEAKAKPNSRGEWPDPLPSWYAGMKVVCIHGSKEECEEYNNLRKFLPASRHRQGLTIEDAKLLIRLAESNLNPEEVQKIFGGGQ